MHSAIAQQVHAVNVNLISGSTLATKYVSGQLQRTKYVRAQQA